MRTLTGKGLSLLRALTSIKNLFWEVVYATQEQNNIYDIPEPI